MAQRSLSHATDDVVDDFDPKMTIFASRDKAVKQFAGAGICGQ
jgi:hypothetical protein